MLLLKVSFPGAQIRVFAKTRFFSISGPLEIPPRLHPRLQHPVRQHPSPERLVGCRGRGGEGVEGGFEIRFGDEEEAIGGV